jgi:hypothetical protein
MTHFHIEIEANALGKNCVGTLPIGRRLRHFDRLCLRGYQIRCGGVCIVGMRQIHVLGSTDLRTQAKVQSKRALEQPAIGCHDQQACEEPLKVTALRRRMVDMPLCRARSRRCASRA